MISNFLDTYFKELVTTIVCIILFVSIHFVIKTIVIRFSKKMNFLESRTNLIMKYIDWLIILLAVISLIGIWGVEGKQAFVVISSIFTVIGVAMFAQWSILSNITAGIILFFSFPFKIGDKIRILDKEFPIEAEIIDIKSFYTLLRSFEGEEISFPNSLLLQKGIVIIPHHTEMESEIKPKVQGEYLD